MDIWLLATLTSKVLNLFSKAGSVPITPHKLLGRRLPAQSVESGKAMMRMAIASSRAKPHANN